MAVMNNHLLTLITGNEGNQIMFFPHTHRTRKWLDFQ